MKTIAAFDEQYRREGIRYLCGVDEAGRGALAGPVVAAALILPENAGLEGVDDSKKLSEKQRNQLEPLIRREALAFGIGLADVGEIDRRNILQATFIAMKRAVDHLAIRPDYLLVDGRDFPRFIWRDSGETLPGTHIIKGDARSLTIAAASVLAKVYRDRLMTEYAGRYAVYNWARNKGYGTKEHIQTIREHGASPLHRRVFLRKIAGERF